MLSSSSVLLCCSCRSKSSWCCCSCSSRCCVICSRRRRRADRTEAGVCKGHLFAIKILEILARSSINILSQQVILPLFSTWKLIENTIENARRTGFSTFTGCQCVIGNPPASFIVIVSSSLCLSSCCSTCSCSRPMSCLVLYGPRLRTRVTASTSGWGKKASEGWGSEDWKS